MKANSIHDIIRVSSNGNDSLFKESFTRHSNGALGVVVDSKVDNLLLEMQMFSESSRYDDETELVLLHESATRIHNDAMELYGTITAINDDSLIIYTEAKLMGLLKTLWTKSWNIVIKLKDIVVKFFAKIMGMGKGKGGASDLSFSSNGFKISHEALFKTFPADKAKGVMDAISGGRAKDKKMASFVNENDAKALVGKGITGDGSEEDLTRLFQIICSKVTVASGSLAGDTMYQNMIEKVFGQGISETFMDLVGMAKTKDSKDGLFKKKTSDRTLRDVVRMSMKFSEDNKNVSKEFPILDFNTIASNNKAGLKLPTEKTMAFYNNGITKEGKIKVLDKPSEGLNNAIKALVGGVQYGDGQFTYEVMGGVLKTIDEYNTANAKFLGDLKNTLGMPKATTSTEEVMKAIDATLGFCFEVFMGKSEGMMDWPIEKVVGGLNDAGIVVPGNLTIAQLSALIKYNNIDLLLNEADKEIGAIDGEKVDDKKSTDIMDVKFNEADNSNGSALAKLASGEGSDKSSSNGSSNNGGSNEERANPMGGDDNSDKFSKTAEDMKKNTSKSDDAKKKQAEADAKNSKGYKKSQDKLAAYLNKVRKEREKLGSVQAIADITKIDDIKKSVEYIAKLMGDFPYDNNFKSVKQFIQIEGASTKMMMNMFNTIKESLIIIKDINESTRSIPGDMALRIWGVTKIFIIASDSYSMVKQVKPEMDKKSSKGGLFKKKNPKDEKGIKELAKKGG